MEQGDKQATYNELETEQPVSKEGADSQPEDEAIGAASEHADAQAGENPEAASTTADPAEQTSVEAEELAKAKAQVAELEEKLAEMEKRYLRLYADFENFRRRARQEMEAAEKYRAQSLASDLLPVLDNFERALKIETENEQAKSILQGVEMVYRSLLDALRKEGVEVIEAVGKPFDPHLHQAVMQTDEGGYEPNTVVEELQKGYKLKDRILRPAMVKVSQ
ncbi:MULTISPECIES: nucleotide exchange factor GrpE [Geobacillus]|jgi:molecular chaperone GrpE|uniref:Protein GrpE n=2 Tax=Geobacillus thermodenitrificans TaxID=33940 RepID=GRPE_GEOTN|nr:MULTISPECIES: nucleotide exchange factor GrpE [Geobacillus]A4IR32.1 RecName: Full=Protein GrpE; AltName: Full=HSP-70 cofactor [Geobacillus thermodenitrificans NG80-2]ABO67786.1 Heat-shock protein GrpE [Geobacillus thermodenitrificans NG80-2]ARA99033.1 nucleotide exchange factor GrpE [Geobacillus thermodenitrificans]ARP43535.1 Protein GrpE [Geobacillus thermodenitrificans]ATO38398.1 nucleotide exchange factor GrpE [Geobacillus thermodenitrificans]KQB92354.1 Protein GrpE [Geobacillus sp. PA-